jgi:hypothetical protein
MKAVKAPGLNAPEPPALVNAGSIELGKRNHAVLTRGDPSNDGIRIGIGD